MYKLFASDMDGTLLDSMGMWQALDRRFLRENGIEPPPDISDSGFTAFSSGTTAREAPNSTAWRNAAKRSFSSR